jgi:hypothetical protein
VFKAGKGKMLGASHGADMGTMPYLKSGFDYMGESFSLFRYHLEGTDLIYLRI